MTTRQDVERLARANAQLSRMAKAELLELLNRLPSTAPDVVRDALLEIVPALVAEYGDLAATAALEWYEEVRAEAGVTSRHVGQLSLGKNPDDVQRAVRWAAGGLYGKDLDTVALVSAALERFIRYSARDTVRRNVAGDPAKPRWARVPRGQITCAFCTMIASRGFVYHSEKSASVDSTGDLYHDGCDCEAVVEFDAETHHIQGYDPDTSFEQYAHASRLVGSTDPNEVAYAMRRLYPNHVDDGVHDPLWLAENAPDWVPPSR